MALYAGFARPFLAVDEHYANEVVGRGASRLQDARNAAGSWFGRAEEQPWSLYRGMWSGGLSVARYWSLTRGGVARWEGR